MRCTKQRFQLTTNENPSGFEFYHNEDKIEQARFTLAFFALFSPLPQEKVVPSPHVDSPYESTRTTIYDTYTYLYIVRP
jgi:hypothetical protein